MLVIHPTHPQERLLDRVSAVFQKGGIVVYPTDSGYALGCSVDNKEGVMRIRQIRDLSKHHNFTLMCRDLSEISLYARVDNAAFRLLKAHTPGPYTFVLPATRDVPKRLQHPKRKTIGFRIPENPVALALLKHLNSAILSVSLILPGEDQPVADIDDLPPAFSKQVDEIVDGGHGGYEPTTVVDLTEDVPRVLRYGKGDSSAFE